MERFLHRYIFHISLVLLVLSLVVFSSQVVLAMGKPEGVGNPNTNGGQGSQGQQAYTTQNQYMMRPTGVGNQQYTAQTDSSGAQGKGHMPAFAQQHLKFGKLHACQAVENSIKTRSEHMNDLALRMEKTFDSIALGMENHYLTQLVPQGKTVANYDTLVADIQTQKSALLPLLAATQNDIANFSCSGNNPAAQLTQYRTDMQAVLKGLQAYRTSVKNLIVAIATVEGVSEKNTTSPTSEVTPIVSPTTIVNPTGVQTTP